MYYEDDMVQALPLSFKSGGGLYIVLPKSGNAVGTLSSMTNEYFNEIQENSIKGSGTLKLPRFSIENDIRGLKESLVALGVPLFDENAAVLTGGLVEGNNAFFLSDAIQKVIIKVDEEGTTAAAVTIIEQAACAPEEFVPLQPFEMICDKPFVFILYDNTYDGGRQVLFTGVVNQP
jgi:serpin B